MYIHLSGPQHIVYYCTALFVCCLCTYLSRSQAGLTVCTLVIISYDARLTFVSVIVMYIHLLYRMQYAHYEFAKLIKFIIKYVL